MKKCITVLCVAALSIACQPLVPIRSGDVITAVGTASISAQAGNSLEEKQFKAIRASKLDAYKELSEQIYGVRVSSSSKINDQRLDSDQIGSEVEGVIRAAQVISSYQVGDSYVTELELNLQKMKNMSQYGETYKVQRDDAIIY
ncbi:MAG: LPP20 family lipoprotein [Vibrionaceae bacterium]